MSLTRSRSTNTWGPCQASRKKVPGAAARSPTVAVPVRSDRVPCGQRVRVHQPPRGNAAEQVAHPEVHQKDGDSYRSLVSRGRSTRMTTHWSKVRTRMSCASGLASATITSRSASPGVVWPRSHRRQRVRAVRAITIPELPPSLPVRHRIPKSCDSCAILWMKAARCAVSIDART